MSGERRGAFAGALLAAVALVSISVACGEDDPPNEDEPSGKVVGGGGGDASDDVHDDVLSFDGSEPAQSGRPMVAVASAGYSIDKTEVTNADYDAFLAAVGSNVTHDRAECSGASVARAGGCTATTGADLPVQCVSWCGAFAYCKWAGKRLCGAVAGGAMDFATRATAASQWTRACGGDAVTKFPYGASFDQASCNTAGGSARAVGAQASCAGSVAGLLDMSGNVAEWEDACDGATCAVRGGSAGVAAADQEATCTDLATRPRLDGDPLVGVRCCSK